MKKVLLLLTIFLFSPPPARAIHETYDCEIDEYGFFQRVRRAPSQPQIPLPPESLEYFKLYTMKMESPVSITINWSDEQSAQRLIDQLQQGPPCTLEINLKLAPADIQRAHKILNLGSRMLNLPLITGQFYDFTAYRSHQIAADDINCPNLPTPRQDISAPQGTLSQNQSTPTNINFTPSLRIDNLEVCRPYHEKTSNMHHIDDNFKRIDMAESHKNPPI
jgi:hypothetical protein